MIFRATSNNIVVSVVPDYLASRSHPDDGQFAWAYTVSIENAGERSLKIIKRHWIITDANGQVQTVKGYGVVGEQPLLEPGAIFQYTSMTVLPTGSGIMSGRYTAHDVISGEAIDITIPAFSLDTPETVAKPN